MSPRTVLLAAVLTPSLAFAAGDRDGAPKPTETTKTCANGKIWDKKSKSCVDKSSELLDDNALYDAVREFAYAGQYAHAQAALSAMSDQTDDRVLTYWGFTHRKMGDLPTGMEYYLRAIDTNPANILVRSYMGQALVEKGDLDGARVQLQAILDYGGDGSWAETSLSQAIKFGRTYDY